LFQIRKLKNDLYIIKSVALSIDAYFDAYANYSDSLFVISYTRLFVWRRW